jgi:hypothetical protein
MIVVLDIDFEDNDSSKSNVAFLQQKDPECT